MDKSKPEKDRTPEEKRIIQLADAHTALVNSNEVLLEFLAAKFRDELPADLKKIRDDAHATIASLKRP
jgi:hypothetical protein